MTDHEAFFGKPNCLQHLIEGLADEHRLGADSLTRVLLPFDETLRATSRRIDDLGPPKNGDDEERIIAVVDDEVDYVEELLGASFVICQRYLTVGVSYTKELHDELKREGNTPFACIGDSNKETLMRTASSPIHDGGPTQIEVINGFANYFKHASEWRTEWSTMKDRDKRTALVVAAAGAHQYSTGNLRAGASALGLGIEQFCRVGELVEILARWRWGLAELHRKELLSRGLIVGVHPHH